MTTRTGRNAATTYTLAGIVSLAVMAGSSIASAEPFNEPAGIDLSSLNTLMLQIVSQDRSEPMTSLERLNLNYSSGRQGERGLDDTMVTRANLLNSPAARYFVGKVTDSTIR